ncbi:MAG: element excision factor XisH family protein [Candidatus Odinarchaeota archaeon]
MGLRVVLIDLGAEKLLAVEKNGKKIAIEIKSFENHRGRCRATDK